MEKFRPYGDAATGINPFISIVAPTTAGLLGSYFMFPMRLFFCSLFLVLLTLADVLAFALFALRLQWVARGLLLVHMQRGCLRCILFFIGHILPRRLEAEDLMRPSALKSSSASNALERMRRGPGGGEVVLCNLQSVWDVLLLEVQLGTPFFAVAFPPASGKPEDTTPVLFLPSLFSRWAVWRYIRRTGTSEFLAAANRGAGAESTRTVDLAGAQAAAGPRVPLVYWGEGTCTNGKGVLRMDAVRLLARGSEETKELSVWAASLQYDTPAVHTIVSDGQTLWTTLYRAGCLLYGSLNRQWESPFFPSATFACLLAPVPLAKAGAESQWTLSEAALQSVRQSMCLRGPVAVPVTGNDSVIRRQPLAVGTKEKEGFVHAYTAMVTKMGAGESKKKQ